MDKAIAIVGHGIAGTALALTCLRRNIPFHLYGVSNAGEASWASSGLIAPVTGRRYVKTWRIDELLPLAIDFYRWSELLLQATFFHEVEIVRFLSNEEAVKAWSNRMQDPEYNSFISLNQDPFVETLHRPYGIMTGAYQLNTPEFLQRTHVHLRRMGLFTEKEIKIDSIDREKQVLIWATGAISAQVIPGIIPNKGEALIVHMPDWSIQRVMKDELYIVPLGQGKFWVGSYYERYPDTPFPTLQGKQDMLEKLKSVYTGRIEVVEHTAGIRPTVVDRRPVIGPHPGIAGDFVFNGMGTKGTSLAPFWADQLLTHLVSGVSLPGEVSPNRYMARAG